MRRLGFVIVFAAVVCMQAGGPGAEVKEKAEKRFTPVAKRLVDAINAHDAKAVQAEFAKIMRDALPADKATPVFDGLLQSNGKIERLGEPHIQPPEGVFPVYFAGGMVLDMKIVLDAGDKIIGLWFMPHVSREIPVKEKHETALRLPFAGDWLTFWGGDAAELNQHHGVPNQQYGFDFIAVDSKGSANTGDGTKNEDYAAFGGEILAPAAGEVVEVIDGVRDNTPPSMNPYSALGNAVFIRHMKDEVSVLAHLKQGSTRVKVGDKVAAGQVIGLCGNSGNSSQPHLHYHLQNTPVIQDGTGIKVTFSDAAVVKDGKPTRKGNYSPVKGDVVRGKTATP